MTDHPTDADRLQRQAAARLAVGLVVTVVAAVTPVGLTSGAPAPWGWVVWVATWSGALAIARASGLSWRHAAGRLGWLLPVVLLFAAPAAWLAPADARITVGSAIVVRAWSAASFGAALAMALGPSGVVRGARGLRLPGRIVDVLEATLASLTIVLRQAHGMLRAREARRTSFGAWDRIQTSPVDTVRGFGRLVSVLLLRSLERAEAVEQARRARGGGM